MILRDEKPDAILTINGLSAYPKIPKSPPTSSFRKAKSPVRRWAVTYVFRNEAIGYWVEETPPMIRKTRKLIMAGPWLHEIFTDGDSYIS